MKTKYSSYVDESEILNRVLQNKDDIACLFNEKISLDEVIKTAVGANTYRAFRSNGMIRPSNVFKKWALSVLGEENEVKSKLCMKTKKEFDDLFYELSNSLLEEWDKELMGMNIFRSRKMVALLLKKFCFWEKFDDIELQEYIWHIPIPLDSRTISAVRLPYNKLGKYKIPSNVTMGFVNQEGIYTDLQEYFHYLANKAGVPVIYFDYLYYDFEN